MKSHFPIIVTIVVAVVGMLLSMVTASWLEDPRDQADRMIDEQVDLAQRMLVDYAPVGTQLSQTFAASATQPADVPNDQWQTFLNNVKQKSAIKDPLQKQNAQMRTLADAFKQLDGETPPSLRPPGNSSEAYRKLAADLKQNETQIADALRIVQAAIQNNPQGGSHPEATRLEAILCYYQADLKRRQAAIQYSIADEARETFIQQVSQWRELEVNIRSLDDELKPSPEPQAEAAMQTTAAPVTAMRQELPDASAPHKRGVVGRLLGRLFHKNRQAVESSEPPKRKPATLPSLDQRIARLKARQAEVSAEIRSTQKEIERLTEAITLLEQKIADASAKVRAAQQRMFELDKAGVDPSDPEALNRFIDAYNKASAANRIAFRELTILQQGALRNAHVDTTDPDEMLTEPLVPIDPSRGMVPERGLVALQGDLKATQALAQTQQSLAEEIDRQLEALALRRKDLIDRKSRLEASQSASAEQAARDAGVAIAAIIEADAFENEAIKLIQGQGLRAAQRAQSAASKRISDARASNAENNPDSPNPRLSLIAQDRFIPGHALTLAGDLQHMLARIYARRAHSIQTHSQMLKAFESIGLQVTPAILPEGQTLESVPASAVQSEAAASASQEAQTAMIEAAQAALEKYEQADDPLKQLWVLHANMGTVHYLLANAASGQEAQQHRDAARQEYQRALLNREDRPEAPIYKTIIAELTE